MSTAAEDIEINLDETPAKDGKTTDKKADAPEIEVVKTEPAAKVEEKPIVKPEEGLEKLKKQLDSERQAREDAERRAADASAAEVAARTEAQTTQLDFLKTTIETIKQSQKTLRSELAIAYGAQDFEKVAELQEQMGDNSAKLVRLEEGKTALEKAPKPTPRVQPDIVEQFVSNMTPQSAAWVRAHPEYVRDPKKNRAMIAAHELAMSDDIKVDTPEYFEAIEKTLRIAAPKEESKADDDPMKDAAQAKPNGGRQAAPAAAPVSRSGSTNGSRPNVVRLTPEEVEAAEISGMTPEEYARTKLALKKEGKLN